jgi:hypothetical protein
MRRHQLIIIVVCCLYFFGQLSTGTALYVSLLFTAAIGFGLFSIIAAGGIASVFGMLNAILVGRVLLVGIGLKIALFEPADRNLLAPDSTAAVMALGFLGVLIGSWLQRQIPTIGAPLIPGISGSRMYLAMTAALLIVSLGGYVVVLRSDLAGEGLRTGGMFGIARNLASLKSFPIVGALLFAWAQQGRRFMTHPLVLGVLLLEVLVGLFGTGKQEAIEPILLYIVIGALRYGVWDKRLWALTLSTGALYTVVIYPYSQYVRNNGGREGSLSDRLAATEDVLWRLITNTEFRQLIATKISLHQSSYLGREELEPFSRLAMVGEADRLIAATDAHGTLTGWHTIVWGFELIVPSVFYPDKPQWAANNYLAHIVGDVNSEDTTTQVSYGLMANLYNAFSFTGVAVGSMIFFSVFYYILRFFFRNPRWNPSSRGGALWLVILVATYQHSLAEQSVAGLIAGLTVPFVVMIVYGVARVICLLLKGGWMSRRMGCCLIAEPS